jgi:hypoxanthine-DNA glycosylase
VRTSPDWAESFPVVESPAARVLILGSMPGMASLRASRYYSHPRNQFWPLLGDLLGCDLVALDYPERLERLHAAGIALWDVLRACNRRGSLDADIAADSMIVNDFAPFFARHPNLASVCCNGATAERLFRQRVLPGLGGRAWNLIRLPSSSPAHAALDYPAKLAIWRAALAPLLDSGER